MSARNEGVQSLLDLADAIRAAESLVGRKGDLEAAVSEREKQVAEADARLARAQMEAAKVKNQAEADAEALLASAKAEAKSRVSEAVAIAEESTRREGAKLAAIVKDYQDAADKLEVLRDDVSALENKKAELQVDCNALSEKIDALKANIAAL